MSKKRNLVVRVAGYVHAVQHKRTAGGLQPPSVTYRYTGTSTAYTVGYQLSADSRLKQRSLIKKCTQRYQRVYISKIIDDTYCARQSSVRHLKKQMLSIQNKHLSSKTQTLKTVYKY